MTMPAALPASIPSPSESVWYLGPLPLRAYALSIIVGILVAIWLGNKRWIARGGAPGVVGDISVWAVPFGIVGGRLYHVITDNQLYFGAGKDPWRALAIWEGGLGIWGAIALGGVGAWIGCRRRGVPLPAMADALAPGILLAQAIGRWGNWFNQELFGRPTDLPWALEVSDNIAEKAGYPAGTTFHPTFLYESLWAVLVAVVLIWADRRFRMGHGRVFALYVAGYTLGRGFFEYLRIDPANEIFGLRVNLWVSGLVFLGAVAYIVVSLRRHPGRETPEDLRGYYAEDDPFAGADASPITDDKSDGSTDGTAGGSTDGTSADAGEPDDVDADGATRGDSLTERSGAERAQAAANAEDSEVAEPGQDSSTPR